MIYNKKTGMQNCLKVRNWFNVPIAVVKLKNAAYKRQQESIKVHMQIWQARS